MKVLCIAFGAFGHTQPIFYLADDLAKLNINVTMYLPSEHLKKLKSDKIKFIKLNLREPKNVDFKYKADVGLFNFLVDMLDKVLKDRNQYDILLCDSFIDGKQIAERLNIPKVIISYPEPHFDEMNKYNPKNGVAELLEEAGKKYNLNLKWITLNHYLNIRNISLFQTCPELLPKNEDLNENSYFIGPSLRIEDEYNFSKKPGTKLIYIVFGTMGYDDEHFIKLKCIEAFKNYKNTDVVMVVDKKNDTEEFRRNVPSNFNIYNWAPQHKIFKYTDVLIFHGGYNSLNAALFINNIPMICIPFFADQFKNAEIITNLGCGISIQKENVTPEILRDSYDRIIEDNNYKLNAIKIGNKLRDTYKNKRQQILKKLFS